MNRRFFVSTLSLALVIGITHFAVASLLNWGQVKGRSTYDQAAPAMETRQAPAVAGSNRFDQVAAILNQSATGRHLLGQKEAHGVNVQFEEGNGTRFRERSNLILLDANHDPLKAALFFAHEMHRAQVEHEGKNANRRSDARQVYIASKLQEEVEGMMASFQVKMELEKIGFDAANVTFPMENHYRQAYQAATEQAWLSDIPLNEQQLEAIGRAAGEQALFDAFANGEIKTSHTHESYPDYYGRAWDAAHPILARLRKIHIFRDLSEYAYDLVMALTLRDESEPTGATRNTNAAVSQQVQAIVPTSEQLVEEAITVLSKGWRRMTQAEQEAFLSVYDPAGTGEIDEAFVAAVVANYQKIGDALRDEINMVYEPDSTKCMGKRLYYTDLVRLHVCPYFLTEEDEIRKARTLIHEMAHNALLVVDRPYYRPTNKAYAQLTPKGSWLAQLPIAGPVIREIQHNDTLYHPDAYAHFTVAASGRPVATGMYHTDLHQSEEANGEMASQSAATNHQVVDSWTY